MNNNHGTNGLAYTRQSNWLQHLSWAGLIVLLFGIGLFSGCDASLEVLAETDTKQETAAKAPCCPVPDTEVAERDPNRLWCAEHRVYEDECVICHPEIAKQQDTDDAAPCCPLPDAEVAERDPNRLWCAEHSVYEDECVICHPEIAKQQDTDGVAPCCPLPDAKVAERDPNRLWCAEHSVYEDECYLCHPELAKRDPAAGHAPRQELFCNEHGVAERECGICQPQLLAALIPGQGLKVRLPSDQSVAKAGINLGRPDAGRAESAPDFLGQVTFDKNKLAVVSPLSTGVIQEILVDVGETVEAGQLLAVVSASALAEAKGAYISALAETALYRETLRREKDLFEKEISARQEYEKAKAALTASESTADHARQRLLDLGLKKEEVQEVARSRTTDSTLPIRAPFKGTIVEREAVTGTQVAPGENVFLLADLSTMWMELSIPETQLTLVQKGAPVQVRFDALAGLAFEGEITWIAYRVDSKTRMVQARAELPNTQHLLKAGLFGRARLSGNTQRAGLVVPDKAVQIVDGRPIVFAKLEDDLFEVRSVTLGGSRDGYTAVLAGLSTTDEIVLSESYILKSEFLKARLGAGCTDH